MRSPRNSDREVVIVFPKAGVIHCAFDLLHDILENLVGWCESDAPLYLNLESPSLPASVMAVDDDVIQRIAFLPSLQLNALNPAVRQAASIHFEQHG